MPKSSANAPASLRWARLGFGVTRALAVGGLFVWLLLQPRPAPEITLGRVVDQVLIVLPLAAAYVFSDVGYRRARNQIRDWRRYTRHLG